MSDFTHGDCDILIGDCLSRLKDLPDNSVHCVVTSPPYFGLRDYNAEGQIGLEKTYEEFIDKLVEICREVRRVLHPSGTFWLNIGDSYAGSGGPGSQYDKAETSLKGEFKKYDNPNRKVANLKNKDLMMIPARLAIALQDDGWWLRSDIIWHKPNPMPESVRDRPTRTHEHIFLLTKSAKYFYDSHAISEKVNTPAGATWQERKGAGATAGNIGVSDTYQRGVHGDGSAGSNLTRQDGLRNKRDVWVVNTKPFKGAHFAVYPPELIEPCILAGTSAKGCCSECFSSWVRTEKNVWESGCECNADIIPCTVLDPFGGSGTTAGVAVKHGRKAILCELNEEYAKLIPNRIDSITGFKASDAKWL
tara:strand:- start:2517 stop:3602 length:1086 start_codon:yes stop_codon:yes gene_type:complete